ncbi:hypothetical protein BC835DRAFT_1302530 [Cytidiella melzeri]|nr:hypothetical protein BC835DRAFT_1302530 [Cytidiella melzeri]
MSQSSLSSVVSNLVRASMGSSVSSSVVDEDLDRHVAELILKEAKQKAEKYAKEGIRAYLPQPEANVPKTNKRFLSSIIRNTDDHNKTILRAQALAAQEARMERLEQEKQERRARAEEAVEAERLRRLTGGSVSMRSRRRDREERTIRKRRERSWERRSVDDEDRSSRKAKGRAVDRVESDDRRRRHSRSPHRNEQSSHHSRRHRRDKEEPWSRSRARSVSDNGSADEDDRYRDHHHDERLAPRDSRRQKSHDRRRSMSTEGEYSNHRKRRRRSRTMSPVRSAEDEPRRESRSHRSRRHKWRRTPSPVYSEDSRTASDSRSRRHKKDTDLPEENIPDTPCLRNERSRSHSPAAEFDDTDASLIHTTVTPTAADIYKSKDERSVLAGTSNRSSPKLSQSTSPRGSSRSQREQAETGPSSSRPSPPPRCPSLSPGPPPPPTTKSKSSRHHSRSSKPAPPPPSNAPPPLPSHLPSKMDRYFEESYDPRLDVAPLSAPSIPATGLISDAEFAGWDAMLELIRQRREDKEERKRLERWGVGKDQDTDKKKKKVVEATENTVDIMAIEYKKRGAVREWDLGKEGF